VNHISDTISVAHNRCTDFCSTNQKGIITLDSRNASNFFLFMSIVRGKAKLGKGDEH
jgi:hypothetical protein